MAAEIPTTEPTTLTAGDSWRWDKTLGDYPASAGWQLSYMFRGEEDLSVPWSTLVTADGDTFEVRIPAASTDLSPGPYRLFGRVTDGTDVFTVYNEVVAVQVNPATAVNQQSLNQRILAAIEAALEGQALTPEQKRTRVNGREIEYWEPGELMKMRGHYELLVQIERNPDARIEHEVHFT